MRFSALATILPAFLLPACGGGEQQHIDSTARADSSPPEAGVSAARDSARPAAAPITGTVHEIRMIGDAEGYRFEPANITAKIGDAVKFVVASQPPHNVSFDPATLPAGSKEQLFANMPGGTDGSSPMLILENDTWMLSLGGLPPGKYEFHCTPHLAMGMKGEITVTP